MTLPTSVTYGHVTGRLLLAVADTPTDPDDYPDGLVPESATVTFTPVQPIIITTPPTPTLVVAVPIVCTLDGEGHLKIESDKIGVWLVTGQYEVSFVIPNARQITPFRIEVTTAHTEANPLDITAAMPDPGGPSPIPQWMLVTQAQYDALTPAPGTLYLIGDAA